jgi:protein-S-isoprenylcysteine O-methyltransferase Ste14
MDRGSSWSRGASPVWLLWIALIVVQLVLSPFLYREDGLAALRNLGWVLWAVMLVLAWWPILVLRSRGDVPRGASYTQTARLVDGGPYAVVRHPQYLSFMLLSVSLALVVQHWLTAVVGAVAVALVYFGIVPAAERLNARRFGDDYHRYAQRVPRLNLLSGVARLLRRHGR